MIFFLLFQVTQVINSRTRKEVIATVFVGAESTPMENCHIKLVDELFAVETSLKLTERTEGMEKLVAHGSPSKSKFLSDTTRH